MIIVMVCEIHFLLGSNIIDSESQHFFETNVCILLIYILELVCGNGCDEASGSLGCEFTLPPLSLSI